jgi:hypothetical protein
MRFGQIGGRSLFDALDSKGALDHAVPGVDRIAEAIERPPAAGRAHVRGATIRHVAGESARYSCTWDAVLDHQMGAYLDLSDPFAERPLWKTGPSAVDPLLGRTRPVPERTASTSPAAIATAEELDLISRLVSRLRATRARGPRVTTPSDNPL